MIMSDFFFTSAVSDDPPGEFVLPIFILFYIRSAE